MSEKILVLAPYDKALLKAMKDAKMVYDVEYLVIGERNQIIKTCYKNNISTDGFIFYDVVGEIEICLLAKSMLEEANALIFGNIPYIFQQKVLGINNNDDVCSMYIADIPNLNNFLFISSGNRSKFSEFEDKKKAIIEADTLMKNLGIGKTNAVIVANNAFKSDILESKIIKMLLKDEKLNNLNIFDYYNLKEIFGEDGKNNIFKNEINLLIMKNYEVTKVFIDSLNVFVKCKIAYLLSSNSHLAIDASEASNYDNILFSLFIINKITKKSCMSNKKYVI